MKREITPEMYNYNKFPGPKFERLADQIRSEGVTLTLVEDYKNAFNTAAFEQRFSQIMLKFDYIVGDWGNEQLRLRGFYRDDKPVDQASKISRLEDYLLEYCNYGCAYFVLENPEPQELPKEKEEGRSRNNRRSKNSRRRSENSHQRASRLVEQPSDWPNNRRKNQKQSRHFNIKNEDARAQQKAVKREIQEAKRSFVIRQKQKEDHK